MFKDQEIYHAGFVDIKQGSQWKEITAWNTTNARFWKLEVMPYPLVGRFKELCAMYRWVKINYISFYFAASAYSYTGIAEVPIVGKIEKMNEKNSKFDGAAQFNTPNIGPILGADKFNMLWNLDNLIKEESANLNYFEASRHTKACLINGKRYVKFFFRIPKDDRRFVGTDHVLPISSAQNLDAYLAAVYGAKFRRVPTVIYGSSDDFLNFLKFNYIEYKSNSGQSMREPSLKLGIHTKIYVGCTFKTMKDI